MTERRTMETFDLDDLYVGNRLGSGSFSSVFSVHKKGAKADRNPALDDLATDHATEHGVDSSCTSLDASLSYHQDQLVVSNSNDIDAAAAADSKLVDGLAMKTLHGKSLQCKNRAKYAIMDMHNEVRILSTLPHHPNVISLKGISSDFWTNPNHAFLILERLHEPLDKALVRWKSDNTTPACAQPPSTSCTTLPSFKTLFLRKKYMAAYPQMRRVQQAGLGTARALAFLHQQSIVFRDLKPANLGFDKQGNVKLFDFALAQHLERGTTLQMRVGTLRYMAPEVALSEDYDFSADVYSFAMVLWEICTLEKPYKEAALDKSALGMMVAQRKVHPPLGHRIASKGIRTLLRDCWSGERTERPDIDGVVQTLQEEIERSLVIHEDM